MNRYVISYCEFKDERTMVDAFWHKLMSIKQIAIVSGFNASHSITYFNKNSSEDLNNKYKQFHGYDLNWLTARTSYKFTPNNT